MIELNEIFLVGTAVRFLQDCTYFDLKVHGDTGALGNLKRIKELFEALGDHDSLESVQKIIDEFSGKYSEEENLSDEDSNGLVEKINLWRDRIRVLLKKKKVFDIALKCTLNLELLFSGASNFFEDKYWRKFSKIIKHDLEEATKCILVSASTAAAMLLLRSIEGLLREYYEKKSNNKITSFMDWDSIIQELKGLQDSNQGLLDHLNYLRLNLRNPVSHPDKIFEKKEAESLFNMTVNVIEEMCKEIY